MDFKEGFPYSNCYSLSIITRSKAACTVALLPPVILSNGLRPNAFDLLRSLLMSIEVVVFCVI